MYKIGLLLTRLIESNSQQSLTMASAASSAAGGGGSSLDARFQAARAYIASSSSATPLSNAVQLKFYKFYKQATEGAAMCTTVHLSQSVNNTRCLGVCRTMYDTGAFSPSFCSSIQVGCLEVTKVHEQRQCEKELHQYVLCLGRSSGCTNAT